MYRSKGAGAGNVKITISDRLNYFIGLPSYEETKCHTYSAAGPARSRSPHSEHAQYFRWERVVPGDPVSRRPRFRVRLTSSDWRARASSWRRRRGGGGGRAPALGPPLSGLSSFPRRAPRPPAHPPNAPVAFAGMRWTARAGTPPDTSRRYRHFQNFNYKFLSKSEQKQNNRW